MNELNDEMRAAIKKQLTASPGPSNKPRKTVSLWNRSFASDALGCPPDQIEESREQLRKHGLTADFDKEGRLIATSQKHYHDCARAFGMKSGRDGYEVASEEGHAILTGRRVEEKKRELRAYLRDMCNE